MSHTTCADVRAVTGGLIVVREAVDLGLAAGVVEGLDRIDLRERRQLLAEQVAPGVAEAEVDHCDADAPPCQTVRLQRVGADALTPCEMT